MIQAAEDLEAAQELCRISPQKSGVLDELAAERTCQLERERAELESEGQRLGAGTEELPGEHTARLRCDSRAGRDLEDREGQL